jgi:small subunit ribosomal protein S20
MANKANTSKALQASRARKRVSKNLELRAHNRAARSSVRTEVKKFVKLIRAGDIAGATAQVSVAESALDKAAKRGTFKVGKANRLKSRIKSRLHSATASA